MSRRCVSCDRSRRITAAGLCEPCRYDLRFITRPRAHRQAQRHFITANSQISSVNGTVAITAIPGDDQWCCDICNTPIPIAGEYTLIPTIANFALCIGCVTGLDYWPRGWTHPTPRPCLCRACRIPILHASARL